jgi:hypothetical protein
MHMLNDSLLDLVRQGVVDPLEAYIRSVEKDDLLAKLKQLGITLTPARE